MLGLLRGLGERVPTLHYTGSPPRPEKCCSFEASLRTSPQGTIAWRVGPSLRSHSTAIWLFAKGIERGAIRDGCGGVSGRPM